MSDLGLINPIQNSLSATRSVLLDSAQSQFTSIASLGEDFELFLNILTTQLQNQDPFNPVESEQFVDQLTQFSQLEQQVRTNDELLNLQAELRLASSKADASLVGQQATAIADRFNYDGTPATFDVIFNREVSDGSIEIYNVAAPDTVIRTFDGGGSGNFNSGRQTFAWDGLSDLGVPVPAGNYGIRVSAADAEGNAVLNQTIIREGIVEVRFNAGGLTTYVLEGGAELSQDDLVGVGS